MRVWVVVRGFTRGGAERQAAISAAELARRGHEVEVVTFHGGDCYAEILRSAPEPIPVHTLARGGRRTRIPLGFLRLLRQRHPDVVLSYLAGPNLVSLLGHLVHPRPLLVWGIRSTTLRSGDETRLGQVVGRLEPWLSRLADHGAANSDAGRRDAMRRGLRLPMTVVPNGIDTAVWRPRPELRSRTRRGLGVDADRLVILRVGRVHPMKDLPTLFRALDLLRVEAEQFATALVVVAGAGDPDYVASLRSLLVDLKLTEHVRWLGDVDDIAGLYVAADVVVSSSSYGEGFPNVIGEAMASGVPCVGTDVGDTALLIVDPRRVVPTEDPAALAEALRACVELSPGELAALGTASRRRILEDFSVDGLGSRLDEFIRARNRSGRPT